MEQANAVVIRQFETEDTEAVAGILAISFAKKFQRMIRLGGDDLVSFFKDSGFAYNKPFPGYFVAQVNARVVGVLVLKWSNQARPGFPRLSIFELCAKYGFLNILRSMVGIALLHESASSDEAYIEHVAILPEAQGLGIGRQLIEHGRQFAGQMEALRRYTLSVAANNAGAIKLYERLGFLPRNKTDSILTWMLFGEFRWLFMEMALRRDHGKCKLKHLNG